MSFLLRLYIVLVLGLVIVQNSRLET